MAIKAEPRGKYAGVKLHLDEVDSKELLDWYKLYNSGNAGSTVSGAVPLKFSIQICKAIRDLLLEHPDMLKSRTPAQIKAALEGDQAKIQQQLQALAKGKDWKLVQ